MYVQSDRRGWAAQDALARWPACAARRWVQWALGTGCSGHWAERAERAWAGGTQRVGASAQPARRSSQARDREARAGTAPARVVVSDAAAQYSRPARFTTHGDALPACALFPCPGRLLLHAARCSGSLGFVIYRASLRASAPPLGFFVGHLLFHVSTLFRPHTPHGHCAVDRRRASKRRHTVLTPLLTGHSARSSAARPPHSTQHTAHGTQPAPRPASPHAGISGKTPPHSSSSLTPILARPQTIVPPIGASSITRSRQLDVFLSS